MRAVVQRVSSARVSVEKNTIGHIKPGMMILLGISKNDTKQDADFLIRKLTKLRIFSDNKKKMSLDLHELGGQILVISQFTLCANTNDGNRPSFIDAMKPEDAKKLYEYFVANLKNYDFKVQTGEFGAYMNIDLCLDGPVTIILDSK